LQALIRGARVWAAIHGATAVSTDDIRAIAHVSLRHRIILNFEGEAGQIKVDDIITKLLDQVKTPAQQAA
jgi:MoxR-like ATPase